MPHLHLALYTLALALALAAWTCYFLVGYFALHAHLRKFPGPTAARFSRLWLAKQAINANRSLVIHAQHLEHGKFVRIGPNEISIADPAALPIVYAFAGSRKTDYYDAFVSIARGVFTTRDRVEHTRKRKIIAHTFSPNSVREFEPHIASTVQLLLAKWDALCTRAAESASGSGYAQVQLLRWCNALTFDIIGDLAFGASFDMLNHDAEDIAAVEAEDGTTSFVHAVELVNDRGAFVATMGCLPPWVRPLAERVVPWLSRKGTSSDGVAGIARARVNKRLADGAGSRKDILSLLQAGKDEHGDPMGLEELTAEALTQMIAGSDTTSNSTCALVFLVVRHPRVHEKLVAELDEALAASGSDAVVSSEAVHALPYLHAVIKEGLRLHSTSGIGLPRVMDKHTEVLGEVFPAGTILSVPTYTIHRLAEVWGEDANEFRPERWLEGETKEIEKALNIFSFGPRSCVGRNVAMEELQMFLATFFYRYDFKLVDDTQQELEVVEGFLRKPTGCEVAIKRRQAGEI